MKRIVLVFAAIALGAPVATAQDVIAERQELMKRSGQQARLGTQMVRGEAPFDLAKAQGIFQSYIEKASKLPELFPENSKTGGETTAAAAIWGKPDEFKAAVAKFDTESKAALAATKDPDSFKAQFEMVQKNCGACHQAFRVRRN